MLAGMGIVFAFLAMLIWSINVMTALVARYFPDEPELEMSVHKGEDHATIAAISAAVHQYRTKYK